MSKTFSYVLFVIVVYLLIIFPKKFKNNSEDKTEDKTENKADTQNALGLNENADKNGVSQGASGRLKYQMGYTQ